jgi:hypothetical protein
MGIAPTVRAREGRAIRFGCAILSLPPLPVIELDHQRICLRVLAPRTAVILWWEEGEFQEGHWRRTALRYGLQ